MSQSEIEQVRAAIAALEAQRSTLGDEVVETALAPLREKLEALTRPAETPDERKRITVLFADVSGYTAMSENLDPEDVTTVMNRLFDTLSDEITRYGGTIDKYSGDAVMALFGAPEAIENHEEMGVRAALGMQAALSDFNAELRRERNFALRLRIGLHTGEVLAGWVGAGEARSYTVMGDTVNLASRLEHACPVGRVMVSAETARPIHAIFDFEPPRQITVKGKSEPITIYTVVGEKRERGRVRGVAGLTAPMVGRDEEIATLRNAFQLAMDEHPWHAATVIGEAGIGKTRLKREFVGWATSIRPDVRLLSARSYTHTQATPYYLVSRLMRSLFDLGEDVDQATTDRLGKALRRMNPTLDETEFRYQLGSLAGVLGLVLNDNPLDELDPEQRRDRTFLSLERILLRASEEVALLIILDDLHWADAMSIAFLERLLQTIAREPSDERAPQRAMLLLLSRPAEHQHARFTALLDQIRDGPHVALELDRLDSDQSGALVSALLDQELPAELLHLVIDHAQGNPFFVEEILRSLIEEEILVEEGAGWRITQPVADIEVPGTIQDVLAARLDRLPFQEKQILQYAAIIGRTFWQELLTEIYSADTDGPDTPIVEVESTLTHLEERHFVARLSESQLADDWEWIFEHVLIQDVAYSGVLKKVRRRVHREVAAQLEARLSQRTGFLIPRIAYHYERGDMPAKAVAYLQKSGDRSAQQYANEDAVDYYTRALALLNDAGLADDKALDVRYQLLLGREGVYGLMGRREEQFEDLEQLQAFAETVDENEKRAEVLLRRSGYYQVTSDFDEALTAGREAVRVAEQAGVISRKIEGLIACGRTLWQQNRLEDAQDVLDEALTLARRHHDRENEAASLHHLGIAVYYLNDYPHARDYLEEALTIRDTLGDQRGVAQSLSNLVIMYNGLGDLTQAKLYCQRALAILRKIGARRGEAYTLNNLGAIHHALGDLDKARQYHEQALHLFQLLQDKSGQSLALENLGLVLQDAGEYETACDYCEQALALEREIGDRRGEGYSLTYLGLALEGLEALQTAASTFERALALRRELEQQALAVDVLAGLARVRLKQGNTEQARELLEEVLTWIEANGVEGIEYPARVYLTAHTILSRTNQTEDAKEILRAANRWLKERAGRISDEDDRVAFLEEVPLHRELRRRVQATNPPASP